MLCSDESFANVSLERIVYFTQSTGGVHAGATCFVIVHITGMVGDAFFVTSGVGISEGIL